MIPQVGPMELILIGALALIVVGPKDLPLLMRKVGKMVGQAKRLAREFTSTFEELGRQAELEELRKEVEALKRETSAEIEKDLQRTTREIDDAMRAAPNAIHQTGAEATAELESAGAAANAPASGQQAHPAGARPAGPRIEQPVAQPRPRPAPASRADAQAQPAAQPEKTE